MTIILVLVLLLVDRFFVTVYLPQVFSACSCGRGSCDRPVGCALGAVKMVLFIVGDTLVNIPDNFIFCYNVSCIRVT